MKAKSFMLLAGAICSMAFNGFGMESNLVGYHTLKIRKGPQKFTLPMRDLSAGRPYKAGALLPSAEEGDSMLFGDFSADARYVNGELHWVRFE